MTTQHGYYQSVVKELIESDSDKVIYNGKPEHATTLYYYFFKHVQDELLILCQNLRDDVFGVARVVEAAKKAIESEKVKLKILTQEAPQDGKFLRLIREHEARENVTIGLLPPEPKISINFAVVDSKRYRFEEDHAEVDAVACMNDPQFAKTLRSIFHDIERVAAIT